MTKKNLWITSGLLFLLANYPLLGMSAAKPTNNGAVIDRVVAIVNKDVITQSFLDTQMNMIRAQLQDAHMSVPSDQKLREEVLNQTIDRKLQLQAAKNAGIQIDTLELNKALNHIADQNHMSLDQLYQSAQKDGWTISGFRQEIQEEIVVQKLQAAELGPKITVTSKEVEDFIQSKIKNASAKLYHLQDIFIALPEKATARQVDEARQKTQNVLAKLSQEKDFKKVAVELAALDPSIHSGDLGWRPLSGLPSSFVDSIVTMKKSEISKPMQEPNGFHILKLVDDPKSIEKPSNDQVKQVLFEKKLNDALSEFIAKLREQAYIKVL